MFGKNRNKKVGLCVMVVTAGLVLAIVWVILATPGTAWAEKGGKGKTGKVGGDVSGVIFSKVTFDYRGSDGVTSDGLGDYVDGVDRTEMRIGRNFDIRMDFNTHKKKDSLRTLRFPGGFPVPVLPPVEDPPGTPNPCWPTFDGLTTPDSGATGPTIPVGGLAQDAELVFHHQDHDDTPVGCCRGVGARLTVKDDNGETWFVWFARLYGLDCRDYMIVKRLPNLDLDGVDGPDNPGISQWKFSTSTTGRAYVYRDNNPPHAPTEFWGVVTLPMSGIIESLTDETEPTGSCDDFEDSVDCL